MNDGNNELEVQDEADVINTYIRPWRSFIAVLVFCLPSLMTVFGNSALALFAGLFHYSTRDDMNVFLRFIAERLDNLLVTNYFLGSFFLIIAMVVGLLTISFGHQSRKEKLWIGVLLVRFVRDPGRQNQYTLVRRTPRSAPANPDYEGFCATTEN